MDLRPGFIGLGVMGASMAKNVLCRFGSLTVYDVDPGKVEELAGAGAEPARSAAEVGAASSATVLSLPDSRTVEQVTLGPDGLGQTMAAGSIVIDTSTTEPSVSIRIADELSKRGIRFLDAPVSGGPKAAQEGTLSIMVGGDPQAFEESLELLRSMGTTVVLMGGPGAGGAAKMVNQMIVGAEFAVIAEAFALGVRSGLDPRRLYEAIRNGWAGSRILDVAVPAMLERDFSPGGTVNIHWKDLGYALSMAERLDVPTPVTALVREVFKAARAAGDGTLSQPAVVRLWENLLGVEVSSQ